MSSDDIESLYREVLQEEMGIPIQGPCEQRNAFYEGELAFALQAYCIQPDCPPPGQIQSSEGELGLYYKFVLSGCQHDTTIAILMTLKSVFSPEIQGENIPGGSKRGPISRELSSLGIEYMGKWVICKKDGTRTICIRHLSWVQCSRICKVLFSW